jgi:hypothetical protein
MFEHLERPFRPGVVIPSNRDPEGWHFTFHDATGNEYHYRINDYQRSFDAKVAMRRFVARSGNDEMLEIVQRLYGLGDE